jgi:hypothetical protein
MEETTKLVRMTLSEAGKKYGKPRKIFDIMIDDKPYPVYSIDGYEHPNGKWNGCPDTWWLDYSEHPIKGGITPESDLVPYVDKGVNRICWEIRFKQSNYSKFKWDDWDIRSSGQCQIYANGKQVYSFGSRSVDYALAKAQYLMVNLMEHPYNFLNPEEERGRKIWYYGLPATIEPGYTRGDISIVPDYSDIEQEEWWDLYKLRSHHVNIKKSNPEEENYTEKQDREMDEDRFNETKEYGVINHGDALWDGMIEWFRK